MSSEALPDASTREPTPAGIRNPQYAVSPTSITGTSFGTATYMSDSEEVFSEVIDEELPRSSASQDSIYVGRGDDVDTHTPKAGRSGPAEQSMASVFDSTAGPDASVDSVELEKFFDHVENVHLGA